MVPPIREPTTHPTTRPHDNQPKWAITRPSDHSPTTAGPVVLPRRMASIGIANDFELHITGMRNMAINPVHEDPAPKFNNRWTTYFNQLLRKPWPMLAEWQKLEDIIAVLERLGQTCWSANYLFLPEGGGIEFLGAEKDAEAGCLQLHADSSIYLGRPTSLACFAFPRSPEWSYFDLDLDRLEPITDDPDENRESVRRRAPALRQIEFRGPDQKAILATVHSPKSIDAARLFGGRIVIFCKGCPYNLDSSTDDGRHNRMTREDFYKYIQRAARRSWFGGSAFE